MNKKELETLLTSDEIVGKIIRDIAGLEWELDLMLTRYFTAQERFFEFNEVILSRFSFSQKIDILRKMTFPSKMKSQVNAVKSLEKLRKLRNILAHNELLSEKDLNLLYSDNEIMKILNNYPKSYSAEIRANKNRINRLIYSYIVRKNKNNREK